MRILYVPEIIDDLADVRDWYESRSGEAKPYLVRHRLKKKG